ncbi:hypothetical protein F5X71_16495 [Nocardia brasiliensis]|uniref:Uncharacterized protein n=1 Tax=Nocardia brasiliensis TaxID=37326 RepID=A0A6G9XS23_NOCBR|nr:hypothetical protein [Nocardia brasiliensis]QIS03709.1 hypothetical protein F5X71_16495 [Nocardia brasiliensis]
MGEVGLGAVAAVLLAPVAAALTALVYRFPVPMAGYARGFGGVGDAALGSLFYLILGGGPVLAALGAVGGVVAARVAGPDRRRARVLTLLVAAAVALLAAVALAVLEFFIGAW